MDQQKIIDDGRVPVFPYKRPMIKKGFLNPNDYVVDEYHGCAICPENQVLNYTTTNRDGYKEFKSKGCICQNCKSKHICTENCKSEKHVIKHIWTNYLELVEDYRHTFGSGSCTISEKRPSKESLPTRKKSMQ